MISIAEKNLNTEFFESVLRDGLDGSDRADRHEHRRFDFAMGREQTAGSCLVAGGLDAKFDGHRLRL